MTQGIILAAGFSSRAKINKLLLQTNDKSLISHAIEGMFPHVEKIFVVTGYYHDEIFNAIKHYKNVIIVKNDEFERGMFSSILVVIKNVSDDFFILPGDCPFVNYETYEKLLKGNKDIRVPAYLNRKGHPIFLKFRYKDLLLKEPVTSNLKDFRNRHDYEIINTEDKNVLIDIDTMNDFQNLQIDRKEK